MPREKVKVTEVKVKFSVRVFTADALVTSLVCVEVFCVLEMSSVSRDSLPSEF